MPSRSEELRRYLEDLRQWGMSQAALLWSRISPDHIMGTWRPVFPTIVGVHRAVVTQALDAVDLVMFAQAADAGWRYDVTWEEDYPTRPLYTFAGRKAEEAIAGAPLIVLWRIGRGMPVKDAMLIGQNYLTRIIGTEAHWIGRQVMMERVIRDLRGEDRRGMDQVEKGR